MKIGTHLFELYLYQSLTDLDEFCACVSKTPCQTHGYMGMGLAWCFAYACTRTHPNWSKFGGDIAQISAHQFSLSSIISS